MRISSRAALRISLFAPALFAGHSTWGEVVALKQAPSGEAVTYATCQKNICKALVKHNVKTDLKGIVLMTLPECTMDSGSWIATTSPVYGVPSQQIKPMYDTSPECGGRIYPYNYIQYTWTDTGPTNYKDTFNATWNPLNGSGGISFRFDLTKACEPGKVRDPQSGKCLKLEVIPETNNYGTKPDEDTCYGHPIYPLQGAKVKEQSLGIVICGHDLRLVYDSMQRYRSNEDPADTDPLFQPLTHSFDFGIFWASSLHKRVFVTKNDAGEVDGAQVNIGGGRFLRFLKNELGKFKPTAFNADFALEEIATGFYLRDKTDGSLNRFDASGKLRRISYLDGQHLTLTYSDESTPDNIAPFPGLMIKATDSSGRFVEFHYRNSSLNDAENTAGIHPIVYKVIDANKKAINFGYEYLFSPSADGQLHYITWQDQSRLEFIYEFTGAVRPPPPNDYPRPWALTGIKDEEGQNYQKITYDTLGAAVSTELGDEGADKFVAAASTHAGWAVASEGPVGNAWRRVLRPQAPVDLSVTAPNGQSSTITTKMVGGKARLTSSTQPAGAGCPASTGKAQYDDAGNTVERLTFGGKRSCSAYDVPRRLRTVELFGLKANEACPDEPLAGYDIPNDKKLWRKTATRWHPTWHLKTGEAKAGLITYWVYNGQPDPFTNDPTSCAPAGAQLQDGTALPLLCKVIKQPTKDDNGSSEFGALVDGKKRTVQFKYDINGRLTQRIGEVGASDTIKLSYYTLTSFPNDRGHYEGDLQSIEDQNKFVTTFDEYDLAGNVTLATLPTKETRRFEYWPRGFVHTIERKSPTEATSLLEVREYWKTGQLKNVKPGNGDFVEFNYDTAHRRYWTRFNDTFVRQSWPLRPSGKPNEVYEFDGRHVGYQYDDLERIEKVTELNMPSPWRPGVQAETKPVQQPPLPPRRESASTSPTREGQQ